MRNRRNAGTLKRHIIFFFIILMLGLLNLRARAQEVDFDKNQDYSETSSVANANSRDQMIFLPNSVERIFRVKFLSSIPKAQVIVFNQQGTISYNKVFANIDNNPLLELKLWDELAPGTYYLQVNTGSGNLAIQQIVI